MSGGGQERGLLLLLLLLHPLYPLPDTPLSSPNSLFLPPL
jgi:hypothetical protein